MYTVDSGWRDFHLLQGQWVNDKTEGYGVCKYQNGGTVRLFCFSLYDSRLRPLARRLCCNSRGFMPYRCLYAPLWWR